MAKQTGITLSNILIWPEDQARDSLGHAQENKKMGLSTAIGATTKKFHHLKNFI